MMMILPRRETSRPYTAGFAASATTNPLRVPPVRLFENPRCMRLPPKGWRKTSTEQREKPRRPSGRPRVGTGPWALSSSLEGFAQKLLHFSGGRVFTRKQRSCMDVEPRSRKLRPSRESELVTRKQRSCMDVRILERALGFAPRFREGSFFFALYTR